MGRPIKFRAWNGRKIEGMDELLTPVEIEDLSLLDYLLKEDDRLKNYVLMQFTGLLDKNGKEIYEGDILKDNSNKRPWVGVVQFESGKFVVESRPGACHAFDIHLAVRGHDGFSYDEVLGNIYENPDLLKREE